jgi:hypothetical protein
MANTTTELNLFGFKFEIERLSPSKQFNLVLKVIGIIAKSNQDYSGQIQQALHNQLQTGETFDISNEQKFEGDTLTLLLSAVKGALSSLSDTDRDYLINSLLSNVKIYPNPETPALSYTATMSELDKRFTSFMQIVKLLTEVVKINFTGSTAEK